MILALVARAMLVEVWEVEQWAEVLAEVLAEMRAGMEIDMVAVHLRQISSVCPYLYPQDAYRDYCHEVEAWAASAMEELVSIDPDS